MGSAVRRWGRLLGVWAAAASLALLLLGQLDPLDLYAAAGIGLVAVAVVALTDACAVREYRIRPRWLWLAVSVPHRTVVDFLLLVRELFRAVRGRPPVGAFRAKPFDRTRPPGWRALLGTVGGFTPNAYVVEVDPERGRVLVHDLVVSERSESPA